MKRKIYIHVGQTKTGSSALQAALSINSKVLEKKGISYPFVESDDTVKSGVCTGNILHVMQKMASTDRFKGSIPEIFQRYFINFLEQAILQCENNDILLSSESLSRSAATLMPDLIKCLDEDCDFIFIAFVRDPYFHILSAWKQAVKKLGTSLSLEEHIENYIATEQFTLNYLKFLVDSGLNVKFINYDHHKKDIVSALFRVIDSQLDVSNMIRLSDQKSNPSIAFWQSMLIVMSRRYSGSPKLSALLIRHFLDENENCPDPYFKDVDEKILQALDDPIACINAHLPMSERLRTSAYDKEISSKLLFSAEQLIPVFETFAKLTNQDHQNKLKMEIDGLPIDFDTEVYLLLNHDVALAQVDPRMHYVNHGRFEGRRYK